MSIALTNRRLAIVGDSRAALQTEYTYYSSPTTQFFYENLGFVNWLRFLSKQKFDFIMGSHNFGVGGETSDQVLARVAAMLAATDAQVIIPIMTTNDRAAQTAAFSTANLAAVKTLLRNARRIGVWPNETPRGDASFTSQRLAGAQLANHFDVSQYINGIIHEPSKGMFAAETFGAGYDMSANNGDVVVGQTYDGLHDACKGGYAKALAILPLIEAMYAERDLLPPSDTGYLNTNTAMSGTGGTLGTAWTGNVATGWTGVRSSGASGSAVAGSQITDADGVTWQQLVLSGTPTGSSPTQTLQQDITTGFSVGQTLDAVIGMQYLSDLANVFGINLRVVCLDGASATLVDYRDMDGRTATELMPSVNVDGVMRVPNIVIPANTVTIRLSLRIQLVQNAACAGTIRVRGGGIKLSS